MISKLAFLATTLAPAVAFACPSRAAGDCGGSSFGGYLVALGVGLLAGVGSMAFERALKKR